MVPGVGHRPRRARRGGLPASAGPAAVDAPSERVLLVGAELPGIEREVLDEQLDELGDLARTAGCAVVGADVQRRDAPEPGLYFGKGKVAEWQAQRDDLHFDAVICNDELSPRQQRNLERALGVKVVDRAELILDIFAQHARTREGRIQVEAAQLHHMLPRLVGGRDLSRLGGGIGTRGPGEQKLEVDRRRIRTRLRDLERELGQVRRQRALHRERRARGAQRTVALVGYTNAGKSSLLNALTRGGVVAEDRLFATLDPTTRTLQLPGGHRCLLTDTVGFIQNLPTDLVAAFRATLEEVTEADLLLHVVDVSRPAFRRQMETVHAVLEELKAMDKPAVLALNKVDLVGAGVRDRMNDLAVDPYVAVVPVSARTGEGLDALRDAVGATLAHAMTRVRAVVPYTEQALVAAVHRDGVVHAETFVDEGVSLDASVPDDVAARLGPYLRPGRRVRRSRPAAAG